MLRLYDYLPSGKREAAYASLRAWLDRVAALPGHIAITQG